MWCCAEESQVESVKINDRDYFQSSELRIREGKHKINQPRTLLMWLVALVWLALAARYAVWNLKLEGETAGWN